VYTLVATAGWCFGVYEGWARAHVGYLIPSCSPSRFDSGFAGGIRFSNCGVLSLKSALVFDWRYASMLAMREFQAKGTLAAVSSCETLVDVFCLRHSSRLGFSRPFVRHPDFAPGWQPIRRSRGLCRRMRQRRPSTNTGTKRADGNSPASGSGTP
jgi:hypothetical protein